MHAIFVDFVGQLFPRRQAESHVSKEFRYAGKQAHAATAMPFRFLHQRFHQLCSGAQAFGGRHDGDGTDFRQMRP